MAIKQPPKPRKTMAPKAPAAADTEEMRDEMSPQDVRQRIEIAAYYKAQERGFEPGHELEDWIAAEAEVRGRLEGRA